MFKKGLTPQPISYIFRQNFPSSRLGGTANMKTKILLLLVIVSLLVADASLGQIYLGLNNNWIGSGVRARSMGGAYIGLADDASAITWNPAGLIQTLDPQISFTGSYIKPNSTIDLDYGSYRTGPFRVNDNRFRISYASFVAPIKIKEHQFSASVAYQRLNEFAHADMQNPYIWAPVMYSGWDSVLVANLQQSITGGLDVINVGFGTLAKGDLAIGMSANIYIGTAEEEYYTGAEWMDIRGSGQYAQEVRRLFRAHSLVDADYSGFNLTFGLHYTYDKLKVGATLKTPFKLTRKYEIVQNDTVWETASSNYVIVQQSDKADFYLTDFKTKYEQPLTLGVGLGYQITPDFTVAADFEWRRFGRTDISYLDSTFVLSSGEQVEYFTDYWSGFRNAGEGRVGFEYMYRKEAAEFPIRGGFRYIQHYDSDVSMETAYYGRTEDQIFQTYWPITLGDRLSAYAVTGGTGVHWERIWLDLGFEYFSQPRTVSGFELDYTGLFPDKPFTGDNDLTETRVTLNFTGFF
jgi:long-subunit fatty acid transport protein